LGSRRQHLLRFKHTANRLYRIPAHSHISIHITAGEGCGSIVSGIQRGYLGGHGDFNNLHRISQGIGYIRGVICAAIANDYYL
jgi:hypothetical protein